MNLESLDAALLKPHERVTNPAGAHEARFLALLYLLLIPISALTIALQAQFRPEFRATAMALTAGLIPMFAAYGLARSPWFRASSWLTILLGLTLTSVAVIGDPGNPTPYAYLLIPALLGSTLLPLRQANLVGALSGATAVMLAARDVQGIGLGRTITLATMIVVMLAIIFIGAKHRSSAEQARRKELEIRDQRQSALLEAGFGGMAFVADDSQVLECSRGFAAIFGFESHEVVGRRLERFLTPTSGQGSGEREALHRDGHIFPVEVVVMPYLEAGAQRSAVALRDLTEHRRLQAQLHQADRMATMGQLAAGVAHEINNPLAWVLGNLDLLTESLDGPSREVAVRATEGARRVQHIVQDLKTFSRTRAPEPNAVELSRAVGSAVNMIRHQVRDRGALIEDYADVPSVDGDETRIGQVCLNLLVNALEALPEGRRDDNRIEVRLYTDASGEAVLEVADNGPGIRADIRHRMFEPFFTTKPDGTGLGLSITRSITASLGGRLQVESVQDVGTTMRVVLPAGLLGPADDRAVSETPVPSRASNREPGARRLLVVDDEKDILELIAAVLGRYEVHTAGSADAAMAALESGPFDAIFCDLMMPVKTGMDFHDDAVARWPALAGRFAFVTGGAYTEEARRFLDETQAPVLHKPFKLADLRELALSMLVNA